jgi:hypothetical protein
MQRRFGAVVLAGLLLACGGESEDNPARDATFTYGAPQPFAGDAWFAANLRSALLLFEEGVTPERAAEAIFALARAQITLGVAPVPYGLDPIAFTATALDPACAVSDGTRVTFTGCAQHFSVFPAVGIVVLPAAEIVDPAFAGDALESITFDLVLDGSAARVRDTLSWSYTVTARASGGTSAESTYSDGGVLTVSGSSVRGHEELFWTGALVTFATPAPEATPTGTPALDATPAQEEPAAAGTTWMSPAAEFGRSVDLEVLVSEGCETLVAVGLLEVKHVWTHAPSSEAVDRAARVDWAGCGDSAWRAGTR